MPDGDYARFMEDFTGKHYPAGDFLDVGGRKVGTHSGAVRYTIGQRKGLGLAMGAPVYVCAKDMQANTVTVGPESEHVRYHRLCERSELDRHPGAERPPAVTARTRYHQTEQLPPSTRRGRTASVWNLTSLSAPPPRGRPSCCIRAMSSSEAAPLHRWRRDKGERPGPLRRFAPEPIA